MVKEINITVAVRYIYREGKVFQHFVFQGNKKNFKYLKDSRFLVYNKLQEKMGHYFLTKSRGDVFVSKREEDDRIIYEYLTENREKLECNLFKIVEFVPSSPGCNGCEYCRNNTENEFIYCGLMREVIDKGKKNCKLFKQKQLYIT